MTQSTVVTEHNVVNPVSTDANGNIVTDSAGNPAGNVTGEVTILSQQVQPLYVSGTLDLTSTSSEIVIPDTINYSVFTFHMAMSGAVTPGSIRVRGYLDEAQSVSSLDIRFISTNTGTSGVTAAYDVIIANTTSETFQTADTLNYSKIRIFVLSAYAAGTATITGVLK